MCLLRILACLRNVMNHRTRFNMWGGKERGGRVNLVSFTPWQGKASSISEATHIRILHQSREHVSHESALFGMIQVVCGPLCPCSDWREGSSSQEPCILLCGKLEVRSATDIGWRVTTKGAKGAVFTESNGFFAPPWTTLSSEYMQFARRGVSTSSSYACEREMNTRLSLLWKTKSLYLPELVQSK